VRPNFANLKTVTARDREYLNEFNAESTTELSNAISRIGVMSSHIHSPSRQVGCDDKAFAQRIHSDGRPTRLCSYCPGVLIRL